MPIQPPMRQMPPGLEALPELALNVRWTWSHAADHLWRELSPEIWAQTRNPWLILQLVPQARLEQCAHDEAFVDQVRRLHESRLEYLSQSSWCSECGEPRPPLVAYFCLEFGLAEALPLYAGGLGILAGDQLKTASDLGVPMIGVGLLYSQGYFRQALDEDGNQRELLPPTATDSLPVSPALDADGTPLCVTLSLPGRVLLVRVWQVLIGRVSLLLLDCNDPRNGPADRGITATLYPAEPQTRLLQQLVLGIGGWRALGALGYAPEVCHINEGPAALVTLERARALMRRSGLDFEAALWAIRPGNIFTSHTPVAAAFDTFPAQWMLDHLGEDLARSGIDGAAFLALGRSDPHDAGEPFNPAFFGLRTCGTINAVSRIHRDVSRRLYLPLFPRRPVDEVPISHVTNGVHVPSWDSAWADDLWTQACGKRRWHGTLDDLAPAITALDDDVLWQLRNRERRDLVAYVRTRLVQQLHRRGQHGVRVDGAAQVLDPDTLTLGFARRFASYKRPNLLLHDPARLTRLLTDLRHPVQLVVAGKAHPRDGEGKEMIRRWNRYIRDHGAQARVVFLEDYDLDVARELVQGVDVWINTPRRPWEACGTSGMKVLVNGGLNLSERDGWWAEAYAPEVGWELDGGGTADEARTDEEEAEALYRLLEEQVVPLFYRRNAAGIPQAWVARMRASMSTLAPRYSSNRMLREYFLSAYCPGAAALVRRGEGGARLARELQQWAAALSRGWPHLRIGDLGCRRDGARLRFDVQVDLGDIDAESVAVELYADGQDGDAPLVMKMQRGVSLGAANAHLYHAEVETVRPAADFTPRVVPCHAQALVPLELPLIHWGEPPLKLT